MKKKIFSWSVNRSIFYAFKCICRKKVTKALTGRFIKANKVVLAMRMINSLLPRLVATMLVVFTSSIPIKTQVASAIAQGKRAHTYIWYDTWGNMDIAKTTMDYFLPRIQTPKNSIVALDFEHGALASVPDGYGGYVSSDAEKKQQIQRQFLYGMRRIKQAGYTPMYYSYKPFTLNHVNYQQIIKEFPNSLWIACVSY